MTNGKKKGEGNTKNGNRYLAWAFVEAANFALRFCAEAKRFDERKRARTNNVVATKALAPKLAQACFHILKERKPFDVTRCFAWSHDGGGKPGKGPGQRAMRRNGIPLTVTRAAKRIARDVSQQGVGAGTPAATSLCNLLATKRHQGSSGAAWPPGQRQTIADRLILMGDWRDSFGATI